MLSLVVFVGFVMQQYVIVEMIWPKVRKLFAQGQRWQKVFLWEMAFRASLVLLAGLGMI